ncbi:occludin/ELL domain containing 1, partial [Homo sapiens]
KEAQVAARVWREFEMKRMDPGFLDKQRDAWGCRSLAFLGISQLFLLQLPLPGVAFSWIANASSVWTQL